MSDDFEAVAAACGITSITAVEALPAGLENGGCILTTDRGQQVLRISQQRSIRQIDAEVSFTSELRALGFKVAPRFLPLRGDQYVVAYDNMVVSSYEYFDGDMVLGISEDQYGELLQWMELLIQAEQRINTSVLAARSAFPDPASVAQRFARLLERAAEPTEIEPSHIEEVSRFLPPSARYGIHSDIHLRNLIWDPAGHLQGLIDFDDCCVGSQLIEFTTFVRGVCFAPVIYPVTLQSARAAARFMPHRLELVWKTLRAQLHRGFGPLAPEEMFTALLWSCMYFAVVVNRPRPHTGVPELKMQDILRTQELIRHRADILRMLG
jgi:Phosphotransferase enzyme family